MEDHSLFWASLFLVLFLVIFGMGMLFISSQECKNKFSSFENRWGFFSECQIMVDGKWIPAESYYVKEDFQK
jgi:hypothetical protein